MEVDVLPAVAAGVGPLAPEGDGIEPRARCRVFVNEEGPDVGKDGQGFQCILDRLWTSRDADRLGLEHFMSLWVIIHEPKMPTDVVTAVGPRECNTDRLDLPSEGMRALLPLLYLYYRIGDSRRSHRV
eukprot:scaffold825_cov249-Pinguiococcus_pyrenoidosus.AAC.15